MIDPAEVRDRTAQQAEEIARHLLGEPNRRLSNKRELRWGNHGSFKLDLKTGDWHDWQGGTYGDMADLVIREVGGNQSTAFQWLCRWLGIENGEVAPVDMERRRQREAEQAKNEQKAARERAARRLEALAFWNEARPLLISPGEGYLRGRLGGRDIPHPVIRSATLRFHPSPYSKLLHEPRVRDEAGREAIGGLVAFMIEPLSRYFAGIQRTFLDRNCRKIARKMLGGSGVTMLVDRPAGDLAITEGIEKGIRLIDFFDWDGPLWATMTAANMASFPVLPGTERLTIFADNDIEKNGRRAGNDAAACCMDRWRRAGRRAEPIFPPVPGVDWDNYLAPAREFSR
jgi:putative DNA primase/helicase